MQFPLRATSAAALIASSLSGCVVIPLDASNPSVAVHPATAASVPHRPALNAASIPSALQARLYPMNETAGKMGPLSASITDWASGHATFSVTHAGEQLRGEASRVSAGYPGFGRVHRIVVGDGRMPAGQRGIASATGSSGSYVQCEYALMDVNRGTGVCLFSNGGAYQLHFGS